MRKAVLIILFISTTPLVSDVKSMDFVELSPTECEVPIGGCVIDNPP